MSIPTIYKGIEYRSRHEARWAAFFDRIGWQHTFEPFDGAGYIPDFLIHGDRPMIVEIKPAATLDDFRKASVKMTRGLRRLTSADLLILGVNPISGLTNGFDNHSYPTAGLIGTQDWHSSGLGEASGREWTFEPAAWMTCGECSATSVFDTVNSFQGRPCGHYDGDHLLGWARTNDIHDFWAEACNRVKWYGTDAS